jgi:hypothetical protein
VPLPEGNRPGQWFFVGRAGWPVGAGIGQGGGGSVGHACHAAPRKIIRKCAGVAAASQGPLAGAVAARQCSLIRPPSSVLTPRPENNYRAMDGATKKPSMASIYGTSQTGRDSGSSCSSIAPENMPPNCDRPGDSNAGL